jgi:putative PIN family toxin of toxin-antitoxin system
MNIVLDTNTVVSGSLWSGAPCQVIDLARNGVITLFTSPELLAELVDVLRREKFATRLEQAQLWSMVGSSLRSTTGTALSTWRQPNKPQKKLRIFCGAFLVHSVSHYLLWDTLPLVSYRYAARCTAAQHAVIH